jgi:hypothetical protein
MHVVLLLLAMLAAAPVATNSSDISQAERLYQQARYADALKALGESCQTQAAPGPCERLRAFIFAALGREDDARAAFARMLDTTPDASLGDDVAPKLRGLFEEAQRDRRGSKLELESVQASGDQGAWKVKLRPPPGVELGSVTAHIAAAGSNDFQTVPLSPEGDVWVGSFQPSAGGIGTARYFLTAVTKNGAAINSGSSAMPKEQNVAMAVAAGGARDSNPTSESPTARAVRDEPLLPEWAWWAIGGAAVVAAGVTAVILLTGDDPAPGTLVVGIRFEDE